LKGAVETIERDHPVLIVELEERHHAGSAALVSRWLADRGYHSFVYASGRLIRCLRDDEALDVFPRNVVFVHQARKAALARRLERSPSAREG
jgi:hypothetical protein